MIGARFHCVASSRNPLSPDALVLVDVAVADGDDAVGAGGDVRLVRDDDDRVALFVEFLNARLGVECALTTDRLSLSRRE